MKLFLIIMGAIFIFVFACICVVDRIMVIEDRNPEFHDKMERFRVKWRKFDPITNFISNAFWWVIALLVIYYIYLG
jgi:hypothetical protein